MGYAGRVRSHSAIGAFPNEIGLQLEICIRRAILLSRFTLNPDSAATGGDRGSMARKKRLKLWQIWHVKLARPASRRSDGDHRCYQIIAPLVRGEKSYWVGLDTTADPPMWASFAVFDDYGREVGPRKRRSRVLSKRCLHKCFFKTRNPQINITQGGDTEPGARPGFS